MAKNFEEILNLVNAGNQMGLSNTIKRDYGIPLDFSSIQASYDEAVVYAATSAKAYVGQTIAVGDSLYIISDKAKSTYKVDNIEYDNYLKPVGLITTGDSESISVTADGLINILGFAKAQDGTFPIRKNGKLVWQSFEAIGAGDGNDNTTYDFTLNNSKNGIIITPKFNGQHILEGEGESAKPITYELVFDFYSKAEASELFLKQDQVAESVDTLISEASKEPAITSVNDLVAIVQDNSINVAALLNSIEKNNNNIVAISQSLSGLEANLNSFIQPKSSDEILVGEDGTLEIKQVSTDKLTQGINMLVLSGGNAKNLL